MPLRPGRNFTEPSPGAVVVYSYRSIGLVESCASTDKSCREYLNETTENEQQ